MADRNGYIGRAPSDSSVVIARQTFSPSGITTDFTFASGYSIGYIDAYLNGARLVEGQDFTATDGSVISLTSSATGGDIIELIAYKAFNVGNVTNALGDFTVSGKLTVVGITSASNANYTGVVTATSFSGDGSNLTGVAAAGLGTALSSITTNPLNKIYYVNNTLDITETVTVDAPATATLGLDGFRIAYTNFVEISVGDTYDLIIADGDELVLNVLSLT